MTAWDIDPSWPAGMRHNNPGNLKWDPNVKWEGATGPSDYTDQGQPQVVFQSPELGFRAMAKLAINKYDKGLTTPEAIVAGAEGWTPGYMPAAANVATMMGMGITDDLNLRDPAQLKKFMTAMIQQEHGPQSKLYPDTMVDAGINLALASREPNPNPPVPAPNAETAQPVISDPARMEGFDMFRTTGQDPTPTVEDAGKPQVKAYDHVDYDNVDPQVRGFIDTASSRLNLPLNVTSGFRDLNHPVEAEKPEGSLHRHTSRKAVDLDLTGRTPEERSKIIQTLVAMGATGVGVYENSPNLMHVDWSGLGASYKGPGTISGWYGKQSLDSAPDWFKQAVNSGLELQKQGALPEGVAIDTGASIPSWSSMPPGPQQADMTYSQGWYPDPKTIEEQYLEERADRAAYNLDPDDTNYWNTAKAVVNSSWFIPLATQAFDNYAYDPKFKLDDHFDNLTENIPREYWDQFQDVGSLQEAQARRAYVQRQMQEDRIIADAGASGIAMKIAAEILDPVTLAASIGTEGALAPFLYAAKAGRVYRVARAAALGGAGNLAATAALDSVSPRVGAEDYGWALGAGLFIGGALGAFGRSTEPEVQALMDIGARTMNGPRMGSVGAAASPSSGVENAFDLTDAFDFEDLGDAAKASTGRRVVNSVTNFLSDPVAKAEKLGAEAFAVARALVGDPRGTRAGEEVVESVADRARRLERSNLSDWRTTYSPQYTAWAKTVDSGWSQAKRRFGLDDDMQIEFNRLISQYVETVDVAAAKQFPEPVQIAGNKFREIMNRMREYGRDPGKFMGRDGEFEGFKGMPDAADPNYVPKYADHDNIRYLIDKFGYNEIARVIKKEVAATLGANARPNLVDAIGEGYLKRLVNAGAGVDEGFSRIFSKADKGELVGFLRDELKVDATLIDDFLQLPIVRKLTNDMGQPASPRMKSRALANYDTKYRLGYREGYKGQRNGSDEEFSIGDLFLKDSDAILHRYMKDMSGTISLATMKVVNPKTGETIVNGIRTETDWENVKQFIQQTGAARGNARNADQIRDVLAELDFIKKTLTGDPTDNMSSWSRKLLRRVLGSNFLSTMQNMGISQAQELVNVFTQHGFKAAVRSIPAYRRVLTEAGKSVPTDQVLRELQAAIGKGEDMFIGSRRYRVREDMRGEMGSSGIGQAADTVLQKGSAVVSKLSLMEFTNSLSQNWSMRAAAQWFSDAALNNAEKLQKGTFKATDINGLLTWKDASRMRALGLGDDKLARVLTEMGRNAKRGGSGRLIELHMDKWDPQIRNDFLTALDRWSGKAIQENDVGSLSRFMSNPVARLLLQFRTFVMGAYAKQTLYGINNFDGRTFATWTMQMMAGAGSWYLFQKLLSQGEENPDAYMEKKFGEFGSQKWYQQMSLAGFNRSGFTSILPMLYDTSASFAGLPRLDQRTSGQTTSLLTGNPTFTRLDNASQMTSGLIDSFVTGRDLSRQEIKTNVRTVLGNWLPLMVITGQMTQDRPERAPK